MKVSSDPGENYRLWGRYFEFFVPMIWLAAAPALVRPVSRGLAWACGGAVLAGLAGLLLSFRAGIVLFPWDATILLSFFHPDPVRASLGVYGHRALSIAATIAVAVALSQRARPTRAGLALILALGAISVHLDHHWIGNMINDRNALEHDIRAVAPSLPAQTGAAFVLLTADPNEGDLGFLRFDARPQLVVGPPAQAAPAQLAKAQVVVVLGPEAPPGGPWARTYRGERLSAYRRATGPPGAIAR